MHGGAEDLIEETGAIIGLIGIAQRAQQPNIVAMVIGCELHGVVVQAPKTCELWRLVRYWWSEPEHLPEPITPLFGNTRAG